MNFAGCIDDYFIVLRLFTHKRLFRPFYATKKDNFTSGTASFWSFQLERGKEEYVLRFTSFSETFRWNEQYHLNFQSKFSVFVDKW